MARPPLPTPGDVTQANTWGTMLVNYLTGGGLMFDVTAPDYGAEGDGATDDTAAIAAAAAALNAEGGGVLFFPPGTYLTDPMDFSAYDNVRYIGAGLGVTILQRTDFNSNETFLATGDSCYVAHLTLDGDQSSGSGVDAQQNSEFGLVIGSDCLVCFIESTDHYDHGIRIDGYRSCVAHCNSHDNGQNPGSLGTADGIYIRDPYDNNLIFACQVSGNARSGIVVTDNDLDDDCAGNKVIACICAGDNGYNEINVEGSIDSLVADCTIPGALIGKNSQRAVLRNNYLNGGLIYCDGADFVRIEHNTIITATSNQRILVNGDSYKVVDNTVIYTGSPSSGYAIDLTNTNAADTGVVRDNTLISAYRGILATGVLDCRGNTFPDIGNAAHTCDITTVAGLTISMTTDVTRFEITNGQCLVWGSAAPTTGDWLVGAFILNRAPSAGEAFGWQCVSAGTPGTWAALGNSNGKSGDIVIDDGTTRLTIALDAGSVTDVSSAGSGGATLTWTPD